MKEFIDSSVLSISVIDYLGKIGNGVGILLNMVVGEITYEIAYWFNEEGHIKIVPEDRLLNRLEIDDIYKYDKINELIHFIHNSLPDPDKILKEFLNK